MLAQLQTCMLKRSRTILNMFTRDLGCVCVHRSVHQRVSCSPLVGSNPFKASTCKLASTAAAREEVTWPELLLPVSAVNDMWPDAADVVTFTVATGGNTTARSAPLHVRPAHWKSSRLRHCSQPHQHVLLKQDSGP